MTFDDVNVVYEYKHRGRLVYIDADNDADANDKFQERFGYYPTEENQNGST